MYIFLRHRTWCLFIVSLVFCGCAGHETITIKETGNVYIVQTITDDSVTQFSPVFLAYDYQEDHNKIGQAAVSNGEGECEYIYVNTKAPTIYYEIREFTTDKSIYTNYVYRIHFPEIPFSLIPFNLTAGKNVGLIVVVTVDKSSHPVLVTTAHTCGCYASIVPTSYLPLDALPEDWEEEPLKVYGERLPFQLKYDGKQNPRILVHLRPGVHRGMNLEVIEGKTLRRNGGVGKIAAQLLPMESLEKISNNGQATSFYYKEGWMKGHVKGSIKYWESTLMSLISLDLFVGMDKSYGDTEVTGNPFYTSLKPWNRNASDMWNFAGFLEF